MHLGGRDSWEKLLAFARGQKFTLEDFAQGPLLPPGCSVPTAQLWADPAFAFLRTRNLSLHAPFKTHYFNTSWKGDRRLKLGVPEG